MRLSVRVREHAVARAALEVIPGSVMAELLDCMVFPLQMNFFSWGRRVNSQVESDAIESFEESELKLDWILRQRA
jgi:hypothetical protein